MRKIHQCFQKEDQDRIRRATIDCERTSLCWYPSAGDDLRHIRFLEDKVLDDHPDSADRVYLHTDMMLPNIISDQSQSLSDPEMYVHNISELTLKSPLRDVSEICYFNPDEETGKVFLVDMMMKRKCCGRTVYTLIPIIYFIAENLSFLVNFLLSFQLRVNTLIHIQDGGGTMGGSKIPMDFIYQVSQLLKLKRVICDQCPNGKDFHTTESFRFLSDQWEKSALEQKRGRFPLLRENSRGDIQGMWRSEQIPPNLFPENTWGPQDGFYHDWTRPGWPGPENAIPTDKDVK